MNGAGAGAADRSMFYVKESDVIEGYSPISAEMLPPEYHSLFYLTILHSRVGGVHSANPLGIRYADNL